MCPLSMPMRGPGMRAEQVTFTSDDGTAVRMVIISGPAGG